MAREFKPVRFFVMMAVAAFICVELQRSTRIAPLMAELRTSGQLMQSG